jgi:hypothetical protein
MLDVGNSSGLEDTVVWLDAVDDEIRRLLSTDGMINDAPPKGTEETIWRFEFDEHAHPYTLRVRKGQGAVQALPKVPERPAMMPPSRNCDVPVTVLETCEMLRDRPATEQPTGIFASRKRSMLWLVDRLLQLQLVAIGARERSQQVQRVHCLMPVDDSGAAFVALALAVASAVRSTNTSWAGRVRLEFASSVNLYNVRRSIRKMQDIFRAQKGESGNDPLRAIPLAELAHVLAVVLE